MYYIHQRVSIFTSHHTNQNILIISYKFISKLNSNKQFVKLIADVSNERL